MRFLCGDSPEILRRCESAAHFTPNRAVERERERESALKFKRHSKSPTSPFGQIHDGSGGIRASCANSLRQLIIGRRCRRCLKCRPRKSGAKLFHPRRLINRRRIHSRRDATAIPSRFASLSLSFPRDERLFRYTARQLSSALCFVLAAV